MYEHPEAFDLICPTCGEDQDRKADFCSRCDAPVGRFTTLDPLKAIHAAGALMRKSATARTGRIALIGTWALFGSLLVGAAAVAAALPAGTHAIGYLRPTAIGLLCLLVLARVTGNYVKNRPGPGPYDPDQ